MTRNRNELKLDSEQAGIRGIARAPTAGSIPSGVEAGRREGIWPDPVSGITDKTCHSASPASSLHQLSASSSRLAIQFPLRGPRRPHNSENPSDGSSKYRDRSPPLPSHPSLSVSSVSFIEIIAPASTHLGTELCDAKGQPSTPWPQAECGCKPRTAAPDPDDRVRRPFFSHPAVHWACRAPGATSYPGPPDSHLHRPPVRCLFVP